MISWKQCVERSFCPSIKSAKYEKKPLYNKVNYFRKLQIDTNVFLFSLKANFYEW